MVGKPQPPRGNHPFAVAPRDLNRRSPKPERHSPEQCIGAEPGVLRCPYGNKATSWMAWRCSPCQQLMDRDRLARLFVDAARNRAYARLRYDG